MQPPPPPAPVLTYDRPQSFFGCLPEHHGPALLAQFGEYVDEWWRMSAPDPAEREPDHPKFYWATVDNYTYWVSKTSWPSLQRVALWWCEMQLSALDAERCIALGRVIDVPLRRSQAWSTFKNELAFKMQSKILDALLARKLNQFSKL